MPDSVQDVFSCFASIPQFYSQFLANQYRLALEYLKLKKASSFLPSVSGGALLIKLSTHTENFRIISYNLRFYFLGQNCCNICNCHHHLQYEGAFVLNPITVNSLKLVAHKNITMLQNGSHSKQTRS